MCPLCKGQSVSYLEDGKILKCSDCGIVFLSPDLKIKDLRKYYGEGNYWHDVLADTEEVDMIRRNSRSILNLIKHHIEVKSPLLLDIGTHDGLFVEEALKVGYRAKGIDPNKKIVARARQKGLPIFEGVVEDLNEKNKFDVITIFHVLEHLANPKQVIANIKSRLNKSGLLVIEVPNIESYLAKKHGLSWKYIAREHLFYFSPATLCRLLEENGFEILSIKKRNFEIGYFSINKIMQYLFPIKIDGDRLKMKSNKAADIVYKKKSPFHKILFKLRIKKILAWLIEKWGRADHILIIARYGS